MTNWVGKEKIAISTIPRMLYHKATVYTENNIVFLHTGDILCSICGNILFWSCRSFHGLIEKVIEQYITDGFYLNVEPYLITYARNCVCENTSIDSPLEINYYESGTISIVTKDRLYVIRLDKEVGYIVNSADHDGFIDMELPRVMKTLSAIGVYSLCF